jgi:uncharacterized membrane protein
MKFPVSSIVFVVMLLAAVVYIVTSAAGLPDMVASHFDAAGNPNSFMSRGDYTHFMLWIGVALPMIMVAIMAYAYSKASNLKVPNREYWMAPQNISATRFFLVGHSVWFGSILVGMICFVHWLVIKANHTQPPHLDSTLIIVGLVVFVTVTLGWALVLLFAFRRPRR